MEKIEQPFRGGGEVMTTTSSIHKKWTGVMVCAVAFFLTIPSVILAQPYISSRGGLVNVVQGTAEVQRSNDMRWNRARTLVQMSSGDQLRTGANSYVEVLMNPGSFARLGPESQMKLVNDQ